MKFFERVRVGTTTTGTGAIDIGAAVGPNFLDFAEAGAADADVTVIVIEDGSNFAVEYGTITDTVTKITRGTVLYSKIGGVAGTSRLSLTGAAEVKGGVSADELNTIVERQITAAVAKTTPVDADWFGIIDSAASNILKILTWSNLKASLAGLFVRYDTSTALSVSQKAQARANMGAIGAPGVNFYFAGRTPPPGALERNGATLNRSTYADLFNAIAPALGACTMTIATPAVVSFVGHGLSAGDPISFETTGALPTGVTVGTLYYVISAGLTANSFRFATSAGGSAVNTTGSQSGTHTLRYTPFGCGNGTTTFTIADDRGEFERGWDHGRGVDSGRVFGSWQDDATAVKGLSATTTATINVISNQPNTGGGHDLSRGPSAGGVTISSSDPETRGRNRNYLPCIWY